MTPGTFGTSTGRGGRLGAWTGRAVDTVGAAVWTASATPETGLGSAGAGGGGDEGGGGAWRPGAWPGRAVDCVGAAVWTASATPETGLGSAGAGVGDDEVAAVAGPPSACAGGRETAPPVVRPSGSLVPMRIVSGRART